MVGCLCLLMVGATLPVEAGEINADLMERDLRIMEGVLAEILDVDTHSFTKMGASGVEGAYFDGYGVLFLTEARTGGHAFQGVHAHAGFVSMETYADSAAAPLDIVKDRLAEFFQNYAGVIRQLDPDQRVAVRVNRIESNRLPGSVKIHVGPVKGGTGAAGTVDLRQMAEEMKRVQLELERVEDRVSSAASRAKDAWRAKVSGALHHEYEGNSRQLMAWITKRDLDRHQGTSDFRSKIQFDEVEDVPHKNRAIRVFSGILDTALGNDRGWFGKGTRTSGFYQKGIGSVFFLEHDLSGHCGWVPDHVNSGLELEEDANGSFGTMQALIGQVVAEYGSTIRSVRPDEHIVINVKVRNPRGNTEIP